MPKVTSADGISIDYDIAGSGPTLILVAGALQHRAIDPSTQRLIDALAKDMTVINYDRRGRGESGDTKPYAVAREIEDIEALIDAAGTRASLYGLSSGAVLAIEAASALASKVDHVVAYEPPIDVEQTSSEQIWAPVKEQEDFAARGDGGGAVVAFMRQTGAPPEAVEGLKQSPQWPSFASVGHTLAYDFRLLAEVSDGGLPQHWQNATMPVLILNGDKSFAFMEAGADAVAAALPNATRKTLKGQTHDPEPEVLAPVLRQFLTA